MKESTLPQSSPLKKWSVLVLTAIAVGYLTVIIDLLSAGLNDVKKGICFSRLERWSLLSPYLTCPTEDWYTWLRIMSGGTSTDHNNPWLAAVIDFPIYIIFGGIFILFAGYLTYSKAPLAKQSGIPEIKLIVAGLNYHTSSYLGAQPLLFQASALVMVKASGLWLGKEGPLAQVACSILTAFFQRVYGTSGSVGLWRELLCAATATGIAVAFNSPIGGVLFVAELLRTYFFPMKIMWNSFVASTIALVVVFGSKAFTEGDNYHEGSLFEVLFGNISWLFTETIPFVFLGLAGGYYGHIYTQSYLKCGDKETKKRLWKWLSSMTGVSQDKARYMELLCVAVVTAISTFPLSMSRLSLEAYLKLLFTDCPAEKVADVSQTTNFMCDSSPMVTSMKLLYVLLVGFALSVYAYGLSLPGGILMPSLVLGGTLGRLVGIVSHAIQSMVSPQHVATCTAKSCIVSPSSYAVVGAAAFMTGITKLTVAAVVIIFELTGALTYVVPIMVAVMTAKVFNDWLSEYNIYDAWIVNEFNSKNNPQNAEYNLGKGDGLCQFGSMTAEFKSTLPNVSVERAMIPASLVRSLVLYPETPYSLSEFYAYLSDDNHEGYPLLTDQNDNICVGYVTKKAIYELIMRSIGSSQPSALLICFKTTVPETLTKRQQQFEQEIHSRYETVSFIWLDVEPSTIMVHSNTPLKQVVELFEMMHVNSVIITEYTNRTKMGGFIDRFVVSSLIHNRFDSLQDDRAEDPSYNVEEEENLFIPRRDRESIDLIS